MSGVRRGGVGARPAGLWAPWLRQVRLQVETAHLPVGGGGWEKGEQQTNMRNWRPLQDALESCWSQKTLTSFTEHRFLQETEMCLVFPSTKLPTNMDTTFLLLSCQRQNQAEHSGLKSFPQVRLEQTWACYGPLGIPVRPAAPQSKIKTYFCVHATQLSFILKGLHAPFMNACK